VVCLFAVSSAALCCCQCGAAVAAASIIHAWRLQLQLAGSCNAMNTY
jgi:hypothetical protein